MKFIKYIINNYFFYFLLIYSILGIYFSLQIGITHDEHYDLKVWQANQNIILNFLFNSNLDTSFLVGGSKFYGSGFHIFSLPIEYIIEKVEIISNYNKETRLLISKHASVFILFIISSLILRKILICLTNDVSSSNIGTIFYLFYPYLLGHSFFNVKDIPFLGIWLVCTYLIIKINKTFIEKNIIKYKHIILLSFFTAYLLSIRVSGVLIFVQYLIFFLVASNSINYNILIFLKKFSKKIFFTIILFIFFFLLIQPNYWSNPLQFFDAIRFMSQHIQTVCTLTLGQCMKAQNLPATYIPIWLFFKLPILILSGFFLYPIIEKKYKRDSFILVTINSLIFSLISIIFILIFFSVNLYDEIRQVMFLVPILIIISLVLIHKFSKKYFYLSTIFFIVFFVFQNIKLYPYNYVWINNFSHITQINSIFELDYWGVASKPTAEFIKKNSKNSNECIVTIRPNGIKPFVNQNHCILEFNNLHNKVERPFYVSFTERTLNKSTPNNCKLIFKETKSVNFSKEKLIMAKVYRCD